VPQVQRIDPAQRQLSAVRSVVIATFTLVGGVLAIDFTDANGEPPATDLVNEILQASAEGRLWVNSGRRVGRNLKASMDRSLCTCDSTLVLICSN